jgi:DNA invertase Pin-like site-specific DNA recombinase
MGVHGPAACAGRALPDRCPGAVHNGLVRSEAGPPRSQAPRSIRKGTAMLIGYGRTSTADQHLALQLDALKAAGVAEENIYTDAGVSGKTARRPGLDAALAALKPGDTLIVWKLDRLGRSVQHLVEVVNGLGERKIGFRSLTESMDTTGNGGKLISHIFAGLAEFERGLIHERTMAGLEAARAKGHRGGRKPRLSPQQVTAARKMRDEGQNVTEISRVLGVARPIIYRALDD